MVPVSLIIAFTGCDMGNAREKRLLRLADLMKVNNNDTAGIVRNGKNYTRHS